MANNMGLYVLDTTSNVKENTYIENSSVSFGIEVTYNGWSATDYIDCRAYTKLIFGGSMESANPYNSFYDSSKKPLVALTFSPSETEVNVPTGACYFRLSAKKDVLPRITVIGADNKYTPAVEESYDSDMAISELDEAKQITDTDLFVLEQSGKAKKLVGGKLSTWFSEKMRTALSKLEVVAEKSKTTDDTKIAYTVDDDTVAIPTMDDIHHIFEEIGNSSINLYDKAKSTPDAFIAAANGQINPYDGVYCVSDYIPVRTAQPITIGPRLRHFLAYNQNKEAIRDSYRSNPVNGSYTFTPQQNGYVRCTFWKEDDVMVVDGNESKEYAPYGSMYRMTESVVGVNPLLGKKWAICGDSFTAGSFDDTILSGPYAGEKSVYGYLIANRCGMKVQWLAMGGRTLAKPKDGTFTNTFIDHYQDIDPDADYITLYFGINDGHHNPAYSGGDGEDTTGELSVGTKGSTDTSTFYGAWNTVLPWLLRNRPFAHIGIIVSNGCDDDIYRTATIEMAKKYGIPYIDLNGDERTPAMLRTTNPNIPASVKKIKMETQRVSAYDWHPNVKAHEFESYIIENFLKGI